MSLILTAPPAGEPVSLAEVKTHLRITHTDDDSYLARLITAARRQIENQCGCALLTQSWSLYLDRWPDDACVRVPIYPVASITDIIIYGESDTPATLDPAHYYLDSKSRPARVTLRNGRPFPQPGRSLNGIEIRLQMGYGASASSVPDDIRQAILLAVANWFANRGEGATIALPPMTRELLAPYRAVRLA
jgi:uncharacterized phiE125 gp8 family phage protein